MFKTRAFKEHTIRLSDSYYTILNKRTLKQTKKFVCFGFAQPLSEDLLELEPSKLPVPLPTAESGGCIALLLAPRTTSGRGARAPPVLFLVFMSGTCADLFAATCRRCDSAISALHRLHQAAPRADATVVASSFHCRSFRGGGGRENYRRVVVVGSIVWEQRQHVAAAAGAGAAAAAAKG